MADEIKSVILDVQLDTGDSARKAAELRDTIKELTEANKANKRENEEQKAVYEITEAKIKSQREQLNLLTQSMKNQETANKSANGSFNQLQASLKVGEAQLKQLAGTIQLNGDKTGELTKKYFEQKKQVDEAKQALLLFNAGISQGNLNVGNYDNTLEGMRQKLEVLRQQLQSTDIGSDAFKNLSKDIQDTSFNLQVAEGKIDSMGERVAKNKIKDGFNDAQGAAQALTGAVGLLSLAMGTDSEAGETLRKIMIGLTVVQTSLTLARQKDDIVGTLALIRTKAATAAQWLYTAAIKATQSATYGLAAAITATGVGAFIVGIGVLADKMGIFKNKTDEAADAQKEFNKVIEVARSNQFAAADELIKRGDEQKAMVIEQIKLEKERAEVEGASKKELLIYEYRIQNLREQGLRQVIKETEAQDNANSTWRQIKIAQYKIETEGIRIQNELNKSKQVSVETLEDENDAIKIQTLYYGDLQKIQEKIYDQVIENLKPGLLAAYGFTEEEAKQIEESITDPQIKAAATSLDVIREMYVQKGIIMSDEELATIEHYQRMGEYAKEFGEKVGAIFGDSITEAGLDLQKFAKGVSILLLDSLRQSLFASLAETAFKQISSKGFAGIVTTGILSGLITAAFEVAKAGISSIGSDPGFYEGGYTGEGDPRQESTKLGRKQYKYHKDEYVVPSKVLNDPDGNRLVAALEKMRVNNPIKIGGLGKADGGFASNFSKSLAQTGIAASDLAKMNLFVSVTEIENGLARVKVVDQMSTL